MLGDYGMERIFRVDQLFLHSQPNRTVAPLVAKVVDECFLSGTTAAIHAFVSKLKLVIDLELTTVDHCLQFQGCIINVLVDSSV